MAKKKKKKRKGSLLSTLFLLLIFLVGAGIFLYPTASDIWNRYRNSLLITDYTRSVKTMTKEAHDDVWAEARAYNEQHKVNNIMDAFDDETEEYVVSNPYATMLSPDGSDIMGYIEIPKIDVRLAIYHGVGTEALEQGCGHIEGTSLPIGGESTHAVLSAHRGLPSAKLFTDLDRMEIGDKFVLTILGENLAYEVDQILTVLPHELDALAIEEGKDYVTLVTCTPYGVNSHRMLVRGHRIPYVEEEVKAEAGTIQVNDVIETISNLEITKVVGGISAIVLIIVLIIVRIATRKRR